MIIVADLYINLLPKLGLRSMISVDRHDIIGLPFNRCAVALSQDDPSANSLIAELRDYSSVHGTALQRMAHYYMEAFVSQTSQTLLSVYIVQDRSHRKSWLSNPTPSCSCCSDKSVTALWGVGKLTLYGQK